MNKFYHFRQTNSGGKFVVNENLNVHVIIEARNAEQANTLAESLGIYFNGCEDNYNYDCQCCGDRWSPVSEYDGQEFPHIYGSPVEKHEKRETERMIIHRLS